MAYLLETKYSYPSSAILTLTDDESDPQRTLTRRNIQQAMQWLIGARGCTEPGDTLFFHYSGHGGQVRDRTGREADGLSETLIPLDAECSGMITDDELHEMLVARVVQGSKLTAVVDACHSGTILDLPLKFDASKGRWEQHASGSPHQSVATGAQGQVICFSGCDDDQTSADQSQLSNGTSTGAMTFALIAAAEDEHDTYKSVIHGMRTEANTRLSQLLAPSSSLLVSLLLVPNRTDTSLTPRRNTRLLQCRRCVAITRRV